MFVQLQVKSYIWIHIAATKIFKAFGLSSLILDICLLKHLHTTLLKDNEALWRDLRRTEESQSECNL